MLRRLTKEEKEAIKREMRTNPLYLTLLNPCKMFELEMKTLRLSPEEVFVECVQALDYLKEYPEDAKVENRTLWERLCCELRDVSDAPEEEIRFAVNEIVYVLMYIGLNCMLKLFQGMFMGMNAALTEHTNHEEFNHLHSTFFKFMSRKQSLLLTEYLHDYMDSDDEWLSDDVNDILDKVPKMEIATINTVPIRPTYGIAKGKQTAVAIALECMCGAGWIVDAEGNPVKSSNKFIVEIMQFLGKENANVRQLLSAANNRNEDRTPTSYIKELMKCAENEERRANE